MTLQKTIQHLLIMNQNKVRGGKFYMELYSLVKHGNVSYKNTTFKNPVVLVNYVGLKIVWFGWFEVNGLTGTPFFVCTNVCCIILSLIRFAPLLIRSLVRWASRVNDDKKKCNAGLCMWVYLKCLFSSCFPDRLLCFCLFFYSLLDFFVFVLDEELPQREENTTSDTLSMLPSKKLVGTVLVCQHFIALYVKRFCNSKRNLKGFFCEV